jgi:hypothetical protein
MCPAVAISAFALCFGTPTHAQLARTWVASTGNDANPCSQAAPCRTLAGALPRTNAGGEINILAPGDYGAVTINKAISVIYDSGGLAGVTAITISAGAGDAVYLRGLSIEGLGTGFRGIYFTAGKSLIVQNCVIRHFTGDGIRFQPRASSVLAISDTLVADNGASGIFVTASGSGVVKAALDRVRLYNNNSGLYVNGNASTGVIDVTVADGVAARNTLSGFGAESSTSHARTSLFLIRAVSAHNGTGILAAGVNAFVRSAQSTVTGNSVGWAAGSGGTLWTYGDSYIDGNITDGGTPPAIATR